MSAMLSVERLTRRYGPGCDRCLASTGPAHGTNSCPHCGTVVACADVSFDVEDGEVLGIVGESGSGKSTVAACLAFDQPPTSGQAFLEGFDGDMLSADAAARRRLRNTRIGIVYQTPQQGLALDVTTGGNVGERLLAADWRHVGRIRARASDLLERTEIPIARIDEEPRAFSGGMRQRVQLAKALASRPSLLILDEPTTGLDVSVQARILDLIQGIQREAGVAMVVISHDLGVIRLLTERTLVMKLGRVVEEGLTDQVLEDPQDAYTQLLVNSAL
ncbi:ATP-binding cassette domain-containing protein [Conexibacter sp. JD483]|uniref:ATP-binding cassette domain-containing protein n=1 Tax=unclassified Conexibacter TaxID=2627773 RepID=UPI0027257657|nr:MULTISPECIES: ATP-binding cassette domain-containing protein [unclassified Conexibacter]MDO8189049.1 ATP-binding cassette domain-containing protein [Conexibacter sp. CPCC 205706]MDO8198510.1 ATP-binding cassette domain-containing protein [Conexibacter sp. CPCC 205762]MDR9367596.1 ATP-binding cassette domain-containing protein [Conexibacter sp. JD483]